MEVQIGASRRPMWAAALTLLLILVLAAPAGAAQGGHLDHDFGRGGKLTIPAKLLGPRVQSSFNTRGIETKLLQAGKGRFLLANRGRIFRFEKDGRLDRKFGQGGYVTIEAPSGQLLAPNDVAIDPSGRILIAAAAQDVDSQPEKTPGLNEYGFELHGPPLNRAAVLRLLPNGRPDPSFGSGGVVESTVNAPPPSFEGRNYQTPSVRGLAIASDSQGRPVLAGSFVTTGNDCYPFTFLQFAHQAFSARFGSGGVLETVSTDPAVTAPGDGIELLSTAGDRELFERFNPGICRRGDREQYPATVVLLDAAGAADPGFAPATLTFATAPTLARDARGRVVLAGMKEVGTGGQEPFATRVRANGSLDSGFGHNGESRLHWPSGPLTQIAVDANNRPVFPGGLNGKGGLAIDRLTAAGKVDRRFGNRGVVRIPFSAAGDGGASAVMVDGAGRIVVADSLSRPGAPESAEFIGIARYLPSR